MVVTRQCEAIPESLKNMLLVMHTAGILSNHAEDSQLWKMTWEQIDTFLPNLREDVFKPHETGKIGRLMLLKGDPNHLTHFECSTTNTQSKIRFSTGEVFSTGNAYP